MRAFFIVGASILSFVACQDDSGELLRLQGATCLDRIKHVRTQSNGGSPVAFVACTTSDTVAAADSLYLVVAVINATDVPVQLRTRLDPMADLHVRISGPDGNLLKTQEYWEVGALDSELRTFFLPGNAFIGRWINLTCDLPDYAGADAECARLYSFPQDGEYTIAVEQSHVWACTSVPCQESDLWTGTLQAERITVTVER